MQAIHPLVRKKSTGTLIGVLAGDALGAPYENKRSAEIRADFTRRGGLTLFNYVEPWKGKREIPAGHPTDDSELTAALACSLVECGGFDAANAYLKLRDFIHGNNGVRKSFLTPGKAYGSGGTLRSALRAPTYSESFREFREGRVRVLPTNGALMRCAPLGLLGELVCAVEQATQQSCLTHIHPASQVACGLYTILIHALTMTRYTVEKAWQSSLGWARLRLNEEEKSPDAVLKDAFQQALSLDVEHSPSESEIWPHSGEVMLSLRIALWGAIHADDFVDGLSKVISLGGDTDTYGAIAGGILGARFGVEGIPQEWQKQLIGRDVMENLADQLYKMRLS